jgi:hypothetical protein
MAHCDNNNFSRKGAKTQDILATILGVFAPLRETSQRGDRLSFRVRNQDANQIIPLCARQK